MSIRHYLHGDVRDASPEAYFCAFCDLFQNRDHFFDTSHRGDHQDRYDYSLERWNVLRKKRLEKFYRPATAKNLFALLPKKPKPRTGRFYRWLKRQHSRDDPIGDFASDVQRDSIYPQGTDSIQALRTHLARNRACAEAIQALDEAWNEFKSNSPIRAGLSVKVRFAVFRSDEYRCRICGASAEDDARLEVDHKVPVSKGGTDEMENLWTLCFDCNRGKSASDL